MSEPNFLGDLLVLLTALLLFVPLFQRLGIGTVLAYLVAGIVVGPHALGLVTHVGSAQHLGEFGVVFLLFAVGLELKVERLRLFGARVFGLAAAQVVVTTLVIMAAAHLFGLDLTVAFLIGAGLSFSSTAVVLQLLGERTPMTGALGRTALAILLVQDLMVGPMLVFVSVVAKNAAGLGSALAIAAAQAAGVIVLIFAGERLLLRPLFRLAAGAGAPEVFTGATLLLVLGVGWATAEAGLSMALGALLAGMMVADTEFRHEVAADIQPFRGLFLGLFFMAVGMTLDLGLAIERAGTVVLLTLALVVVKAVVLTGLAAAFRMPWHRALALGALLAQGSEFAFVIFTIEEAQTILEPSLAQLLVVAIGLSMVVTAAGTALLRPWAQRRFSVTGSRFGKLAEEGERFAGHVVIAGFGQVGMALARHLAGLHIPIVVLDLSPRRVTASRSRRLPVFYGNAERLDVLRAARLDRADALVVAVSEAATTERITAIARKAYPKLHIIARVPDDDWVEPIKRAGANAVVLEGLKTAQEMAERVVVLFDPELLDAAAAPTG